MIFLVHACECRSCIQWWNTNKNIIRVQVWGTCTLLEYFHFMHYVLEANIALFTHSVSYRLSYAAVNYCFYLSKIWVHLYWILSYKTWVGLFLHLQVWVSMFLCICGCVLRCLRRLTCLINVCAYSIKMRAHMGKKWKIGHVQVPFKRNDKNVNVSACLLTLEAQQRFLAQLHLLYFQDTWTRPEILPANPNNRFWINQHPYSVDLGVEHWKQKLFQENH